MHAAELTEKHIIGILYPQVGNDRARSAWMNPDTYEPTLRNTFLNSKRIWKKNCTGTSPCSMCVHKVSRKNIFFEACAKKAKNYVMKHYLEAPKFIFFAEVKQKDIFS